ncbi:MAG: 3-hydroxybutyryl-CoA dehydrogenase [Desulfovibrio sp.]|jgi:3-hydroxybutyryl-CoA dehydrogenase|nr:3-hydroxybutyryl-CoA dehydrogenase [Desulfovibrio sp.]
MDTKHVMIVGAGQMGSGIAQVMAQAGLTTYLYDIDKSAVNNGLTGIAKNLSRSVEKGRMSEGDMQAAISLLKGSSDLGEAADCDLVVEAIVENKTAKTKVFAELDGICPRHAILASNTSSVPITGIAAATKRPEKVIGMHFMNPVPVMKLVEIIRGIATDDATYMAVADLTLKLQKTPVEVRDVPGFVSNRVLQMLISEAISCLNEGVATAEGIDNVMKLGMNHTMGPLATADLIGLDTVLSIQQVMYEGYGDPKYAPNPLLRQYVQAGWLGKKTGRGFYTY